MSQKRRVMRSGGVDPRRLADVVNELLRGRVNSTGEVTLASGAVQTSVNHNGVSANSVVILMPKTASAAASLGNVYIVPLNDGFDIHHDTSLDVDRSFGYVVLGA